jgi:hypothetical protein
MYLGTKGIITKIIIKICAYITGNNISKFGDIEHITASSLLPVSDTPWWVEVMEVGNTGAVESIDTETLVPIAENFIFFYCRSVFGCTGIVY